MKPHDIKRAFELTAEKGGLQAQIVEAAHAKWSVGVQLPHGKWADASEFFGVPQADYFAGLVATTKAAKNLRIAVIDAELKDLGVDVKPELAEPEPRARIVIHVPAEKPEDDAPEFQEVKQ